MMMKWSEEFHTSNYKILYEYHISSLHWLHDAVAEWLRRWTANPLGSARVGSNPICVVNIFHFFQIEIPPTSIYVL